MIVYLAVTAGLVARTVVAIGVNFRMRDGVMIAGCLGLGLLGVLRGLELGEHSWAILPVLYAAFAVFVFKTYILQPVTEGMLFLFGLLSAYLFFVQTAAVEFELFSQYQATTLTTLFFPADYFLIFLLVYLSVATALVFTRIRSNMTAQVFYMIMFMVLNVWITYVAGVTTLSLDMSVWEALVIGFVYLPFLANVFYVLYFLPIPLHKHQSFTDRWIQIRNHGQDVEGRYLDVDVDTLIVFANIGFAVIFCAAHAVGLISLPLALTLAVTCGALINRPPHTVFTPQDIIDQR